MRWYVFGRHAVTNINCDEESIEDRAKVTAVGCYSGGVDSTVLAFLMLQTLDPASVRIVLASSFLMGTEELRSARSQAEELGFPLVEIEHPGASCSEVLNNQPSRCYICKHALFARIKELYPHALIYCGENADDRAENRPGTRAIAEFSVLTPLAEAGLAKRDIRDYATQVSLPAALHPSNSCLATRFTEGTEITPRLARYADLLETAERVTHPDAQKVRVRCRTIDPLTFDIHVQK
jgi:uncharacterized protein